MTDTTAGRGGVGIRLFTIGDQVVKRTFSGIGESGKKMWAEIALGERTANPALRSLNAGVNEARGALDGLIGRAGPAGTALSAFGGAGVVAAAGLGAMAIALVKVREGMQFAADLTDAADRIGVGAEALQELRYVADEAGVSVETFQGNLERLNGQVGAFKAGIGDGRLKPIFEELGITKEQLANVRSADEMMMLLADTLGQVQDRAVQVRLAKGLGVEESLPILRMGSEEIRRLSGEARDLGLVMSDEVRTQFDEADRAMEKAQQRIDMSLRVAVVGLADDFANLVTTIADLLQAMGKLNGFVETFMEAPSRAGQWVNDQARRALGMGPNIQRYERLGVANGTFDRFEEFDMSRIARDIDAAFTTPRAGFDPKGHTRGGAAANRRREEREAEQRREREERAAGQIARAQDDVERTYGRGFLSIDGRAHYEIADLEVERVARLREIKRAEEEYIRSNGLRGLTEVEAEQLRVLQTELTDKKKASVEWDRRRDIAARRLQDEEDSARLAVELLDIDAQMATTQRERSRIERDILLATIEIARKRKAAELENDPELDEDERRSRMGDFERSARGQVELFDHREHERLKAQFKGYGREVAQAIRDGRLGEYIGDKLKERLLDGALEQLFSLFKMGQGAGGDGGGHWTATAFNFIANGFKFGGGRNLGGGTQAGRFYTTVEHGRPELMMIGGNGHVTGAAETARMLKESMAETGGGPAMGQASVSIHMPVTIHADNADAEGLKLVRDELRQLRTEMPSIAVKAVDEASERRVL